MATIKRIVVRGDFKMVQEGVHFFTQRQKKAATSLEWSNVKRLRSDLHKDRLKLFVGQVIVVRIVELLVTLSKQFLLPTFPYHLLE